MARKIQQYRGLEKDLPILDEGQLGFTTDTKKVFIGGSSGNVEMPKKELVDNRLAGFINAREFGVIPSETIGNSANLQSLIDNVRQSFIDSNMTIQPVINLESGVYILDAEIKMSPYLKFKTLGTVIFKITHNGTGIHITSKAGDPSYGYTGTSTKYHLFKNSWNRGSYFEGTFLFTSSLDYTDESVNTIALEIGDRNDSLDMGKPISRYVIEQVNVYGVATAIKLNTNHHYIGTIEDCHLELVRHAIVYGDESVSPVNSGEKFVIKDCVIAGSSKEAVQINTSGFDLTFENTSFDFNTSPLFRIKESGVGLRLTNCYIEEIEDGQIMASFKPNSTGSIYGRNTIVINGLQALFREYGKLIENLRYSETEGRMSLTVSVSGFEVRHIGDSVAIPIDKISLIDTTEDITLTNKDMIVNPSHQRCLLTDNVDISPDGDFSKFTIGEDLTSDYWSFDMSNNIDCAIGANGVNGSKSIDVSISNTSNYEWIDISCESKIPAMAGQSLIIMPSIKGANIDSKFSIECGAYFYDANGEEIEDDVYYAFITDSNGIILDNYHYPKLVPKIDLPKGTTSISPYVTIINAPNSTATNYSINNIFMAITGD